MVAMVLVMAMVPVVTVMLMSGRLRRGGLSGVGSCGRSRCIGSEGGGSKQADEQG